MEGADKYAELFKTGQYRRLYLVSGSHARGATFHIQVLPEGETAYPNGPNNLCLNVNAVEVYGVVSGNPGWTEKYGWIHEGKWCDDFDDLVEAATTEAKRRKEEESKRQEEVAKENAERVNKLLAAY